ncbi:hypothetical protein D3C86_1456790 [compost metagenome]
MFDGAEHRRAVVADHVDALHDPLEAGRGHARRQRLHGQQDLGDQVGQALHRRRLAVVILGRDDEDREAQRPAAEGGDAPRRLVAAHRTDGDAQACNAVLAALGAEQGMGADDLHALGQPLQHHLCRLHLHRADVEDQGPRRDVRGDGLNRLSQNPDRHGQHHHRTGGGLFQRRQPRQPLAVRCRRVMGEDAEPRRQVLRRQPPEGAETD